MALAIVGPDVETVGVADSEYMYSTLTWPFRQAAADYLNTDVAQGTRPIVLLYPAREADSALLHALFAHELGHASVDEHDLVSEVLRPLQNDPIYAKSLAAAAAFLQTSFGWEAERATKFAVARLRQWIEELVCDALALRYLGPSYLFGFAAFVLSSSWNDPQPQHPQSTLRTGMLLDAMAVLGWGTVVEKARPDLWAWFEWVKAAPTVPLTPDNAFLRDMCVMQAGSLEQVVAARIAASAYLPTTYAPVAEDLQACFAARVLPAEHNRRPVDRRNILLAGWLYALTTTADGTARPDGPVGLVDGLMDSSLQRFIAKALELSTVSEIWSALP